MKKESDLSRSFMPIFLAFSDIVTYVVRTLNDMTFGYSFNPFLYRKYILVLPIDTKTYLPCHSAFLTKAVIYTITVFHGGSGQKKTANHFYKRQYPPFSPPFIALQYHMSM